MTKQIVAFDESGNSGANLLDSEQPVFVLSSVHFTDDEAGNLIETNSDEMKFSKLKRSSKGKRKIINILNSELLNDDIVLVSAVHKRFMVITKMVDLLIEPMLYKSGFDLYERGANIAMANMLYFCMPAFIGSEAFEAIQTAFNYFKANAKSVSQGISIKEKDFHLHVQDLTGVGMSDDLALAGFLSLCSGVLEKPVQEQTAILGTITIGGSISSIDNLSDLLQVCMDAGARKVLIPISVASKTSNL